MLFYNNELTAVALVNINDNLEDKKTKESLQAKKQLVVNDEQKNKKR